MDERSCAKGVNMIHCSFAGFSPPHTHTRERSHALDCTLVFQKCTLLSTHFFIMPDGFHLWHFTSNKTYYTVWMSTTRKKQGAFNTLPPVSRGRWRQVQGGVFIPPTRRRALAHAHPDTDGSNASDGISFVYARSRTHFKRCDEATVCWWMRLSLRLLNRRTSVFTESRKPSGRKKKRTRGRQGGGRER